MDELRQQLTMAAAAFPAFLIAIVFHEFAHGFVANLWGDHTARDSGRLTLNPLTHIDPIGTVLFPLIGMISHVPLIGWAKPVPINPNRFRKYRPGLFTVSLAGPAMNFLMGMIFAFSMCAIVKYMPMDFYLYQPLRMMTEQAVV